MNAGSGNRLIIAIVGVLVAALVAVILLSRCDPEPGDPDLAKNVYLEMVDWHVAGFWVINSPVIWVRVANYNNVPIKEVAFQYNTYDYANKPLNEEIYVIPDSTVGPGQVRNFIEQYGGLIDLNSQKLSVKLHSVQRN